MDDKKNLKEKTVRGVYDEARREWFFSAEDVCGFLGETAFPHNYWKDLKRKLKDKDRRLHMGIARQRLHFSGRAYTADMFDTENVLRLARMLPSKKTQQFNAWFAGIKQNLRKYSEVYTDSARICVCFSMGNLQAAV